MWLKKGKIGRLLNVVEEGGGDMWVVEDERRQL